MKVVEIEGGILFERDREREREREGGEILAMKTRPSAQLPSTHCSAAHIPT